MRTEISTAGFFKVSVDHLVGDGFGPKRYRMLMYPGGLLDLFAASVI